MIASLAPAQSRLLALALLFLVLAGIYLVVVNPFLSLHRHYGDVIDQSEERLARYRNLVAHKDDLEQRLNAVQGATSAQDFYLRNTTPTLAAAELQEHVKRVIAANQGTLLSTQIMPEKPEGQLVRVTVKVAMRGTIETLQKVFHALEGGRPFLFLDDVFIRAYSLRRGNQMTVSEMEIRFDVSGYIRAGAQQ
jgi:general secretion pathway protein M